MWSKPEIFPAYCVFGGGEPDCAVLWLTGDDLQWPNGNQLDDGGYQATIVIESDHEGSATWRWRFEIDAREDER